MLEQNENAAGRRRAETVVGQDLRPDGLGSVGQLADDPEELFVAMGNNQMIRTNKPAFAPLRRGRPFKP